VCMYVCVCVCVCMCVCVFLYSVYQLGGDEETEEEQRAEEQCVPRAHNKPPFQHFQPS
jgi:hypothetical protein